MVSSGSAEDARGPVAEVLGGLPERSSALLSHSQDARPIAWHQLKYLALKVVLIETLPTRSLGTEPPELNLLGIVAVGAWRVGTKPSEATASNACGDITEFSHRIFQALGRRSQATDCLILDEGTAGLGVPQLATQQSRR